MGRIFIGIILVLFVLGGCQTNDKEEVVNKQGSF